MVDIVFNIFFVCSVLPDSMMCCLCKIQKDIEMSYKMIKLHCVDSCVTNSSLCGRCAVTEKTIFKVDSIEVWCKSATPAKVVTTLGCHYRWGGQPGTFQSISRASLLRWYYGYISSGTCNATVSVGPFKHPESQLSTAFINLCKSCLFPAEHGRPIDFPFRKWS